MTNKKLHPFPKQIHVICNETDYSASDMEKGLNFEVFANPNHIYGDQVRADGKVPIAVYKLVFVGTIEVKQNADLKSIKE